jgi:predicted enzyme related to lactoylglutathione lyase
MRHRQLHAIIRALNYEAAVEFYSEGLELPVLDTMATANMRGTILRAGAQGVIEIWDAPGRECPGPQAVAIAIEVEDLDDWYGLARSKRLNVQGEPQSYAWGRREFSILDPNGVTVSLFSDVQKTYEPRD